MAGSLSDLMLGLLCLFMLTTVDATLLRVELPDSGTPGNYSAILPALQAARTGDTIRLGIGVFSGPPNIWDFGSLQNGDLTILGAGVPFSSVPIYLELRLTKQYLVGLASNFLTMLIRTLFTCLSAGLLFLTVS